MTQVIPQYENIGQQDVSLTIDDANLDFETARTHAKSKALEINANAMQLAWYDRQAGKGFPNYDCGVGDRPPWQVFADARGANLTIDINDGAYLFWYLMM